MTDAELRPGLHDTAKLRVIAQVQGIPFDYLYSIYMNHARLMWEAAEQIAQMEMMKFRRSQ